MLQCGLPNGVTVFSDKSIHSEYCVLNIHSLRLSLVSEKNQISLMLERGEIIRLRRGLYILSRLYGGTVESLEVTNLVYGPSYLRSQPRFTVRVNGKKCLSQSYRDTGIKNR